MRSTTSVAPTTPAAISPAIADESAVKGNKPE